MPVIGVKSPYNKVIFTTNHKIDLVKNRRCLDSRFLALFPQLSKNYYYIPDYYRVNFFQYNYYLLSTITCNTTFFSFLDR